MITSKDIPKRPRIQVGCSTDPWECKSLKILRAVIVAAIILTATPVNALPSKNKFVEQYLHKKYKNHHELAVLKTLPVVHKEAKKKWKKLNEKLDAAKANELDSGSVSETSETAVAPSGSIEEIICEVFGSECQTALRVSYCESKYDIYAVNGQYQGLFQMGESERATYGHGYDAYSQAKAAYAYFLVSGWAPWDFGCL